MDYIARAVRFSTPHWATYIDPKINRILDPCAGEGLAVSTLAQAWGMTAYGVELDKERATKANLRLDGKCLQGSYHQLVAPKNSFSVLFLNPPYDYGQEEDGSSMRQEVQFLRDCSEWLRPDGLLVYIPPKSILTNETFQDLMKRLYRETQVWQFPHPEVESFNQAVVLAQKASSSSWNYNYFVLPDPMPVLTEDSFYQNLYLNNPVALDSFKLKSFSPDLIAPDWLEGEGVFGTSQWDLLVGDRGCYQEAPLVQPRPGHLAMLLASGSLNGSELEDGIILKGSSEKAVSEIHDKDEERGTETVTARERIVSRISLLNVHTKEYDCWAVDELGQEKTAKWFEQYGPQLAQAVMRGHTPQFNGDLTRYNKKLESLRAPGILPGHNKPEFLQQQLEAAAATAFHWKDHKTTIISGEMGTGKTCIAVAACELTPAKKIVVICPSHLVRKWRREVDTVTGIKGNAVTAKKLNEVDDFFSSSSAKYLILSKDTAKLGSRWKPCFSVRKVRITKEVIDHENARNSNDYYYSYRYNPPKKTVKEIENFAACPKCGNFLKIGETPQKVKEVDQKYQQCCTVCKEPLWQNVPITAKGTLRWPLAKYINQKYARRFLLVLDECHAFRGADSDQSLAVQHLASAATKILAMTGTLYGGRASSIFHLLYKVDPGFRKMYKYNECSRFVEHHGLFETKYEEQQRTSVYGYRKGNAGGRVKEIPGMSPGMISILLPFTIFLKLKDLRLELPPYSEEVEILNHNPEVANAAASMALEIKTVLRKHPKVLGQYLMACLGYPDCPEQAEQITETDEEGYSTILATAPAFPEQVWPKDRRVVEIALEEKTKNRKVLVYFTQTHRRDARPRVQRALEAAGLKVTVLNSDVPPEKREEWLEKACEKDFDVMLTNGRLVETGMDLLFASTIIQYGTEYSVSSLRQSVRRSWRLGQKNPVRVVFLSYGKTMQETAMSLISRKMRASEMIDGDETGGLGQFDDSGSNFFLELAQDVVSQEYSKIQA
jgi:superfamily II DNA or RNA helicase